MSAQRIIVVGGGPAGLVAALAARRRGFGVEVLERGSPPIDKPCGEGLMPDAIDVLGRLGVALPERHHPFVGIRYLDGDIVAEGRFPDRPGVGLRRTALHQSLVAAAERNGVVLRWGTHVDGVATQGDGRFVVQTASGTREADWLVAADGLRSRLRRAAGLDGPPVRRRHERFGVRRHLAIAPWTDRVEVYWAEGCEAYVTPVADDEVGVAILWQRGGTGGFDARITAFPALERRIAGAASRSRDLGTGPLRQRTRAVHRGRLALIGDASGYVDALTGEGLALAFHQAEALADGLADGDLRAYGRAHKRIGTLADRLTRLMLWAERRPRLRRRLIRALAAEPDAFSKLLAVHARAAPFAGVGGRAVARLAWRLARPRLAST